MNELGIVISNDSGPSTDRFSFVLKQGKGIKKNQYVSVPAQSGGFWIGYISEIYKSNRYYERAESILDFEKHVEINSAFPVSEWEFTIAEVKLSGFILPDEKGKYRANRIALPPSPGYKVVEVDEKILFDFLGFDKNGLELGQLESHSIPAKINLTRLLHKHLAILAMSGAGKSYLTSVLLEELLERDSEKGRLAIVLVDVHGEYVGFKRSKYSKNVKVIKGENIRIPMDKFSEYFFAIFPNLSQPQRYVAHRLFKYINEQKTKGKIVSIKELIENLEDILASISTSYKSSIPPIKRNLIELDRQTMFSATEAIPDFTEDIKQGNLLILDLNGVIDQSKRNLIVQYVSKELFKRRRENSIPPSLLILEEAHNFAPNDERKEKVLARSILDTIAREGRKFGLALCVITQRPVGLSSTLLSQCNTHIILRVTNPNDQKHISDSAEGIDSRTLSSITSLKTGQGIIVGSAVNSPVFLKVREKRATTDIKSESLEEMAARYEKERKEREEEKNRDIDSYFD